MVGGLEPGDKISRAFTWIILVTLKACLLYTSDAADE